MKAKKTLALLIFKYFPYGGLQRDFLEVAKNINLEKFISLASNEIIFLTLKLTTLELNFLINY